MMSKEGLSNMSLSEIDIIEQLFNRLTPLPPNVVVGMGDDAAVINVPLGHQLVTTIDSLVANVHFFEEVSPLDLGHKALAVNLSDLAAMGAEPNTALLSLTLPEADERWLTRFIAGFFALADYYKVALIGGDLTRGPLNISVVVNGFVPDNQALLQKNAKVGDLIYVTGQLGDAGLAVDAIRQRQTMTVEEAILLKLHRPTPRIHEGMALRGLAHAAVDISDGLVSDLKKILRASAVGAVIEVEKIPLSSALEKQCERSQAWQYALTAGDDYELCFTIPAKKQKILEESLAHFSCGFHCIGTITEKLGLNIMGPDGKAFPVISKGYDHFREEP